MEIGITETGKGQDLSRSLSFCYPGSRGTQWTGKSELAELQLSPQFGQELGQVTLKWSLSC